MSENKIAELEQQLAEIKQQLAQLSNTTGILLLRQEAFIRYQVETKSITFDDYTNCIREYQAYVLTLNEINKETKLLSRVEAAKKYNENLTVYSVYADDINIIYQLQQVGSVNKRAAESFLELPHTANFEKELLLLVEKE